MIEFHPGPGATTASLGGTEMGTANRATAARRRREAAPGCRCLC
jgi:hypothetical protein